ncbi:MAG: GtrA family protein [Blautia wexlerae]
MRDIEGPGVQAILQICCSARLVTMVIEVGGVWLLVSVMGLNDMIGKFLTQFIVLILNYVFSKFFVFTTGKSK